MRAELEREADSYTIEWDGDIGAVIHTWTAFTTGQRFRDGCTELLEVIRTRDASKVLIDTRGIQAHDEADKQWLVSEWIPMVIRAGVEYTATVHPDSVIAAMEMEDVAADVADVEGNQLVTGDHDEARRWLAET